LSFEIKKLEAAVILSDQTFRGGNTKIIKDLAMDAVIQKLGGVDGNKCILTVFGMAQEDIEPLTMLAFRPGKTAHNRLILTAGNDAHMDTAFIGDILPGHAIADYSSSPEIKMTFTAITAYRKAVEPHPPTSRKGVADLIELLTGLFGGIKPELSGEDVKTENPYLSGSVLKQARDLCDMLGYELIFDDDAVYVNKKDKTIRGKAPVITKESGLIGYPAFSQTGINFKCVYNPMLKFAGIVKVESVVPKATGDWRIIGLTHHLTSYIPGGAWESEVKTAWIS
jgi:hypothetical protein